MIDFLKKLQEAKAVKMDYPCIFDESNVVSLFGIMDPSSKGYISFEQYKTGMYSQILDLDNVILKQLFIQLC